MYTFEAPPSGVRNPSQCSHLDMIRILFLHTFIFLLQKTNQLTGDVSFGFNPVSLTHSLTHPLTHPLTHSSRDAQTLTGGVYFRFNHSQEMLKLATSKYRSPDVSVRPECVTVPLNTTPQPTPVGSTHTVGPGGGGGMWHALSLVTGLWG